MHAWPRSDLVASICKSAGGGKYHRLCMVSLPVLGLQNWGMGLGEDRVAAACFQHFVFLTSKSGLKGCVYGQTAGEWGLGHSWCPGGWGLILICLHPCFACGQYLIARLIPTAPSCSLLWSHRPVLTQTQSSLGAK